MGSAVPHPEDDSLKHNEKTCMGGERQNHCPVFVSACEDYLQPWYRIACMKKKGSGNWQENYRLGKEVTESSASLKL